MSLICLKLRLLSPFLLVIPSAAGAPAAATEGICFCFFLCRTCRGRGIPPPTPSCAIAKTRAFSCESRDLACSIHASPAPGPILIPLNVIPSAAGAPAAATEESAFAFSFAARAEAFLRPPPAASSRRLALSPASRGIRRAASVHLPLPAASLSPHLPPPQPLIYPDPTSES